MQSADSEKKTDEMQDRMSDLGQEEYKIIQMYANNELNIYSTKKQKLYANPNGCVSEHE